MYLINEIDTSYRAIILSQHQNIKMSDDNNTKSEKVFNRVKLWVGP